LALASAVSAQPVPVIESQFITETATLPRIVESFDRFASGSYPAPLILTNGTYSAPSPHIGFGAWCPLSNCLDEARSLWEARTFAALPAGTTYWGGRVLYASVGQVVNVTVVGKSGILQLDLPPSPRDFNASGYFFGFHDPAGLVSVSFREAAGPNYSFDDIVTAGPLASPAAEVPTLDGWALAALGVMLALASPATLRRGLGR
jgi:hypothetical protein